MPTASRSLTKLIEPQLEALIDASTDAVFEIPGYASRDHPGFRADVRAHVADHLRAVLAAHSEARTPTRADVALIRDYAQRRAGRISISEFVHAFEIGQQPLWDWALSFADDEAHRAEMVDLMIRIRQYFTLATVEAAEVYLESEHARGATGEGIRRDLLHELLAGASPTPGPRLDAARAAGLDATSRCLVVSAVLTDPTPDYEQALRTGAAELARVPGTALRPLAVVRVDEIVVVMLAPADISKFAAKLDHTQRRLAGRGIQLAIAASTLYEGIGGVGDAYAEAVRARESILSDGGTIVLPAMTAFDYLTWRTDETARHLIAPDVARFIAQDARDGGTLIETLRAYYGADLNAKVAAERLHLHVNTVYYRLDKIAEEAGCNIRSVSEVVEILIAARLHERVL